MHQPIAGRRSRPVLPPWEPRGETLRRRPVISHQPFFLSWLHQHHITSQPRPQQPTSPPSDLPGTRSAFGRSAGGPWQTQTARQTDKHVDISAGMGERARLGGDSHGIYIFLVSDPALSAAPSQLQGEITRPRLVPVLPRVETPNLDLISPVLGCPLRAHRGRDAPMPIDVLES